MRRESGMSLIEIMIGMTVAMGIVFAIMETIQYTTKAAKSTQVSADFASLKSSLLQVLGNFSTCDAIAVNLGQAYNLNVDSTVNYDANSAVNVPAISYNVGLAKNVIATAGTSVNGLVVSSMKLWAISPPTQMTDISTTFVYNQYLVRLQVNATRDQTMQGGGQVLTFQPYTVDFKVLTGPFGPSGGSVPGMPTVIRGCAP